MKKRTDPDFCPLSGLLGVALFQKSFQRNGVSGRYKSIDEGPTKEDFGIQDEEVLTLGVRVSKENKTPFNGW